MLDVELKLVIIVTPEIAAVVPVQTGPALKVPDTKLITYVPVLDLVTDVIPALLEAIVHGVDVQVAVISNRSTLSFLVLLVTGLGV